MKVQVLSLSSVIAAVLAACGGSQPEPVTPSEVEPAAEPAPAIEASPEAAPASPPPATFAEQVALGQQLYGQYCAECHGSAGEGGGAPPVVGLSKGALPLDPPPTAKHRKTQFKTVMDVAAFVTQSMPPNAPGSLDTEQYFSILAFDLKANGIELDQKLDAGLASTLEIPRN